ncbi:ATP synthase subunit delta [compost metagenome]
MSKDLTAAKRYARALYEASAERNVVDQALAEFKEASGVLDSNPDLTRVLDHPNVDTSAKVELIKNVFASHVSPLVLNTLVLLVERKRTELISVVYEQFVKTAGEALGRADAVVYSPKPLTEQETALVAERFAAVTGKKIQITNIVDEGLLGGIKVRIGDMLYDGSLQGKLNRLAKSMQTSHAL